MIECPACSWVSVTTCRFEREDDPEGLAAALFSEKVKGKLCRDHPEFPGIKAHELLNKSSRNLYEQNDCGDLHLLNTGDETSKSAQGGRGDQ